MHMRTLGQRLEVSAFGLGVGVRGDRYSPAATAMVGL
jgi:hypothetical protein